MKRYVSIGAALCLAVGVAGCSGNDPAAPSPSAEPDAAVNFRVTDIPGHFFDLDGLANPHKATRSLAIVPPGSRVKF